MNCYQRRAERSQADDNIFAYNPDHSANGMPGYKLMKKQKNEPDPNFFFLDTMNGNTLNKAS